MVKVTDDKYTTAHKRTRDMVRKLEGIIDVKISKVPDGHVLVFNVDGLIFQAEALGDRFILPVVKDKRKIKAALGRIFGFSNLSLCGDNKLIQVKL